MSAMPLMIAVLCVMAISYRYYSAFLAARVATLNDSRATPAVLLEDGSNFHPTNKWVLFGHHFAAISGAGPLIGPVLAAQFGYLPGLLWIVIGVCLAGAVQDFLVLAASVRRDGKSLAQIAFIDIGKVAGTAASVAILFILIIALAGLGKVVVKALGGEAVRYATGQTATIAGSSWGLFTIACTIPIALFVGFYMYRLRKGRVIEASLIGGALTLAATVAGGWVAHHHLGTYLNLTQHQVLIAMAIYGFIAAVLPVWVLLVPRDYLSSFLKIGTIALLVIGVIIANPKMQAPAINHVFTGGGPVVLGRIFPFLFITIMCGAISGFHSLVSSGTTSKMLRRETDARVIGYGAMLIEGLVAVVAMIAASTLSVKDYYAMNTELSVMPKYYEQIMHIPGGGIEHMGDYERLTQESLRGRTGGGVTLAVGMAAVFGRISGGADWLWKYWYHFAIMFEALFILTTIDAGTRIGRFLLQEMLGKVIHPKLGDTNWWPASLLSTALIVIGWSYFINSGDFAAIWAMFGVANQMLAVIALAIVSVFLVNEGRPKYLWVTVVPMMLVMTTTGMAAAEILSGKIDGLRLASEKPVDWVTLRAAGITASLLLVMLGCTFIIVALSAFHIARRAQNSFPARIDSALD